ARRFALGKLPEIWALAVKSISNEAYRKSEVRKNRIPVSTERTGCMPFNMKQKADEGYNVGENPVKQNGYYLATYNEALEALRTMEVAGWRNYGSGNNGGARKAIGWVTESDAKMLLAENDPKLRIAKFKKLTDVVQ